MLSCMRLLQFFTQKLVMHKKIYNKHLSTHYIAVEILELNTLQKLLMNYINLLPSNWSYYY